MELSKFTTITITSASVIVYGFGVAVSQVGAEVLVTDEVSTQIQEALGAGDFDENVVDTLTQTEYEIKSLGVESFEASETDTDDVAQLKQERQEYVQQLRAKVAGLSEADKKEFLEKIRARRIEVRQKMDEIRLKRREQLKAAREKFKDNLEERKQELKENREQALQERKEKLEAAREQFKSNLEERKLEWTERKKDAKEKFAERAQEEKSKREEKIKNNVDTAKEIRQENKKRQQVQGAVDYQPENPLQWLGYWLQGL